MDNFERMDLQQKTRRRKRAGWILGSYGLLTFALSVLAIVFLVLMISLVAQDLDSDHIFTAGMAGIIINILLVAILFLCFLGFLSILKFIAGVMVHRGKNLIFIVAVMILNLIFSLNLAVLSVFVMIAYESISFFPIIFPIIDIAICGYLIRVLITSGKSFEKKMQKPKRRSIQAA